VKTGLKLKKKSFSSLPYSSSQLKTFRLRIPANFIMLSKLLRVPEEKILTDFMETFSNESYAMENDERNPLASYVLKAGYGQEFYTRAEIEKLFLELESISALWPEDAPTELLDAHIQWRELYLEYWFRKWEKIGEKRIV
jgi:hypothetical protein